MASRIPQKIWYTLAVNYRYGPEIKCFRMSNIDSEALKLFRENVFTAGAYRKCEGKELDVKDGEIIPPHAIIGIDVWKQAHFFNAEDAKKPLTNK